MQTSMFENILSDMDRLLDIGTSDVSSARGIVRGILHDLDEILSVAGFDKARGEHLKKLLISMKVAAGKFSQSLTSIKCNKMLREDWARFAKRDLVKLKDEVLALREFFVANEDFVKTACLRLFVKKMYRINPEKLLDELHETGMISERTWALLMSHPFDWKKVAKNRAVSEELARISKWLCELYAVRKNAREKALR